MNCFLDTNHSFFAEGHAPARNQRRHNACHAAPEATVKANARVTSAPSALRSPTFPRERNLSKTTQSSGGDQSQLLLSRQPNPEIRLCSCLSNQRLWILSVLWVSHDSQIKCHISGGGSHHWPRCASTWQDQHLWTYETKEQYQNLSGLLHLLGILWEAHQSFKHNTSWSTKMHPHFLHLSPVISACQSLSCSLSSFCCCPCLSIPTASIPTFSLFVFPTNTKHIRTLSWCSFLSAFAAFNKLGCLNTKFKIPEAPFAQHHVLVPLLVVQLQHLHGLVRPDSEAKRDFAIGKGNPIKMHQLCPTREAYHSILHKWNWLSIVFLDWQQTSKGKQSYRSWPGFSAAKASKVAAMLSYCCCTKSWQNDVFRPN